MANEVTQSQDMLDPQVLADMIPAKLTAEMKFTPLASVDNTLEGRPGTTIEFPAWNYIGDAEDLKEGEPIETSKLTYGSKAATIKGIAKGGSITDQALLTGYGDPYGELSSQLAKAMANKVDNDVLATLKDATQAVSVAATVDGIQEALDMYNDEDDNRIVLLVSPKAAGKLRLQAGKDWLRGTQLGSEALSKGVYGDILGVQLIRSRKLNANEAFLIKTDNGEKPAIKLMMKRGVNIEPDRKPGLLRTDIYATSFYAPYLYDPTKVVKVTFTDVTGPQGTTGAPKDKTVDNEVENVAEDKRLGKQKKDAKNTGDTNGQPKEV
ncbi:N4-gp56 family major capsid protein [Ligilactobacillus murinus]|uniref:N4-gp56 family major capsid protein n=1 Tax=Ligilactobacillus murinus TaxID=1622 RepID=UPI00096BF3CF|nr:N4-gp56 family major capsid protein [Ligilactobacillus murinus]